MIKNIKIGPRGEILAVYDYDAPDTVMTFVPENALIEPYRYKWNGHSFIETTQFIDEKTILDKQMLFRAWRAKYLSAYDRLGLFVMRGDLDPSTGQPYSQITDAERNWRVQVLNYTPNINLYTTESDYPVPPARLEQI
jgi:hypothetical protein